MSASQESSVRIATGYGLDGREIRARFPAASRPALGPTEPPIQWLPGARSSGVQLLGREVVHTPPSSVEVKNSGAIRPLSRISSWRGA
jgi:hypothetical protein